MSGIVHTASTPNSPQSVQIGGPLSLDAWARAKVVNDKSLIHAMFTNSIVPKTVLKETFNGVEQTTFTNATSDSGELNLVAGATLNDVTVLDTFRSPRYEPNRGHLYSSSIFLDSPTAAGIRDFGMFTEENGAFFRLKADGLYACQRTTRNGGGTTTLEEPINLSILPPNFNLAKGNIYDIQMQWRGVGNIGFYIGNPDLGYSVLVHKQKNLNVVDNLSIANPALPIAYRCENLGDNVVIRSGCADISSEGGSDANHVYDSIATSTDSGEIAISGGLNVPVLAVHNKSITNSLRNMRDIQALGLYGYGNQRGVLRVWITRDPTAITLNDQSWIDHGDGFLEIIEYDNPDVASPITFDTSKAKLQFSARINIDQTFYTPATWDGKSEIHISPGDYLIFTMHRENGGAINAGVTFEFGTET